MTGVDAGDRAWAIDWLRGHLGVAEQAIATLDVLVAQLINENQSQNLIAKATVRMVWSRHIVDSAQLLLHVPRETSGLWLDLGTGAGFPGLVCAVLRPQLPFLLVEQRKIRADWLHRATTALGLANVSVAGSKLKDVAPRKCAIISARAFAPMVRLLTDSAGFSTKRTLWVLPKGRSAKQELNELFGWDHVFHVEQSVTDPSAGIIVGHLLGRRQGGRKP